MANPRLLSLEIMSFWLDFIKHDHLPLRTFSLVIPPCSVSMSTCKSLEKTDRSAKLFNGG